MTHLSSRRDLIKHGLTIAAAVGVAPVLGSSSKGAMSFEEYRGYDALGLAQLVKDKDVTPSELLEIAIARSEAVQPTLFGDTRNPWDLSRSSVDH